MTVRSGHTPRDIMHLRGIDIWLYNRISDQEAWYYWQLSWLWLDALDVDALRIRPLYLEIRSAQCLDSTRPQGSFLSVCLPSLSISLLRLANVLVQFALFCGQYVLVVVIIHKYSLLFFPHLWYLRIVTFEKSLEPPRKPEGGVRWGGADWDGVLFPCRHTFFRNTAWKSV